MPIVKQHTRRMRSGAVAHVRQHPRRAGPPRWHDTDTSSSLAQAEATLAALGGGSLARAAGEDLVRRHAQFKDTPPDRLDQIVHMAGRYVEHRAKMKVAQDTLVWAIYNMQRNLIKTPNMADDFVAGPMVTLCRIAEKLLEGTSADMERNTLHAALRVVKSRTPDELMERIDRFQAAHQQAIADGEAQASDRSVKSVASMIQGLKAEHPSRVESASILGIDVTARALELVGELLADPVVKEGLDRVTKAHATFEAQAKVGGLPRPVNFAATVGQIADWRLDTDKPREVGGHWGVAFPSIGAPNPYAAGMVAVMTDGVMRDPHNNMSPVQITDETEGAGTLGKIRAAARWAYAQEQMQKLDPKHTEAWRGMAVPPALADALVAGIATEIPLTGCTAFSMQPEIAAHYTNSAWTKQHSLYGNVSVLVTVERDAGFTSSIGMFHPFNIPLDQMPPTTPPPYEVLSAAKKLVVTRAERHDGGVKVWARVVRTEEMH